MIRLRIALVALAMLAPSCGKTDEGASETKAPPKAAEPAANKLPVAEAPPPAAFDHAAFCAAVFSPDSVGAILGVEGLVSVPSETAIAAENGYCWLETRSDEGIEVSAKLLVDCEAMNGGLEALLLMQKQMSSESGIYREVDLGKGGAYAVMPAADTSPSTPSRGSTRRPPAPSTSPT